MLSWAMGICCGISGVELEALELGAAFHDIGKLGIPDVILTKPTRLNFDEWQIMKKHPQIGADILLATGMDGSHKVANIILHHHENFDGTGYPSGLKGESIPLASRIITVVDSYDAMAVTRSYHKQPRSHEVIMEILKDDVGTRYDPAIFRHFCEVIESSNLKSEFPDRAKGA